MMARNRLVQEECLDRPARPRGQIVGVGLEITCPAAIDGSRKIVRGIVPLLRGHAADPVRQTRQEGKQTGKLGVNTLRKVPEREQLVLGAWELELFVGTQERTELRQWQITRGQSVSRARN